LCDLHPGTSETIDFAGKDRSLFVVEHDRPDHDGNYDQKLHYSYSGRLHQARKLRNIQRTNETHVGCIVTRITRRGKPVPVAAAIRPAITSMANQKTTPQPNKLAALLQNKCMAILS
jgi:hypothetical protein